MNLRLAFFVLCLASVHLLVIGKELPGDKMVANYFKAETEKLSDSCLAGVNTLADWEAQKPKRREELFEMLGLHPLPEKTELQATITGKIEKEDFVVEKLHFQSMPGLYVTANLYLPKNIPGPLPTILYLSGHAKMFTNGVSLGNKTGYQHHGIWFARNGYACLVVDTLQLGEVEGIHHGTHSKKMWWWNSRGYTPAGVEAWNNIRALDYLETRPEVDKSRFGVTGRSGGGAYSWVIAALDDRIKVSAPVAGITDLENHVVDGAVEGHCDCMFHVNTYRWDYPLVAALTAPRPLLFCNSDKDRIFPLEGIVRTHAKIRDIYRLYGASTNLGLLITEGPHQDTQDLQVPVFRWFNRFLKKEDPKIAMAAEKLFDPIELKVFEKLPEDSINMRVHETFVPQTSETPLGFDSLKQELREKVFAGWPEKASSASAKQVGKASRQEVQLSIHEFDSQDEVTLRLYLLKPAAGYEEVRMIVLDEKSWAQWLPSVISEFPELLKAEASIAPVVADSASYKTLHDNLLSRRVAYLYVAPRGIGLSAWTRAEPKKTHITRRFMLLGQTLDGMRVWDIIRASQVSADVLGQEKGLHGTASGAMGVNLLYATLFSPAIRSISLDDLPESHDFSSKEPAPDYLNVLKVTDIERVLQATREKGLLGER